MTFAFEHEYRLLELLSQAKEPVGSLQLSHNMDTTDYPLSSASIGRMLSDFDRKNYTLKHGYKGRTLTEEGWARLNELKNARQYTIASSQFQEILDTSNRDNLIDVLIARRGIEREIVRLAAEKATEADIEKIRRTFEPVEAAGSPMTIDHDVNFHQAIANASHNKVLGAAFDLIWQHGKYTPVMEYIRTATGGMLIVDHRDIYEAIRQRDPVLAEDCLVKHINGLIRDVERYGEIT